MHVLNSLGWLWRQNGVELAIVLDGRELRVFVLLTRVMIEFNNELARSGYSEPPSVGDCSVGSIWGKVTRAFKKIGKKATHAISRAASSVTRTASKWGSAALHATQSGLRAVTNNPIWNMAATGMSFVPGFGTAVSAGMATAAAIGRNESIKDAALAAAKNALPGGPVAAAAFDVAIGVAKGQRLDTIAINTARNQLPGGPAAKAAFDAGINAVRQKSFAGVPGALARQGASYAQAQALQQAPGAAAFARRAGLFHAAHRSLPRAVPRGIFGHGGMFR